MSVSCRGVTWRRHCSLLSGARRVVRRSRPSRYSWSPVSRTGPASSIIEGYNPIYFRPPVLPEEEEEEQKEDRPLPESPQQVRDFCWQAKWGDTLCTVLHRRVCRLRFLRLPSKSNLNALPNPKALRHMCTSCKAIYTNTRCLQMLPAFSLKFPTSQECIKSMAEN